jgi:hypothetical protein
MGYRDIVAIKVKVAIVGGHFAEFNRAELGAGVQGGA